MLILLSFSMCMCRNVIKYADKSVIYYSLGPFFQVEMAGSSIFDYVHQGDHAEVAEQLGLSLTGHSQGMASPSSSDDGTTHGTMNPDGKNDDHKLLMQIIRELKFPVSSSMSVQSNNKYKGFERSFCIRMKSTLTKRGCQFKQSTGHRVSESDFLP